MGLRWDQAHWGNSWRGVDDHGLFVGHVVRCQDSHMGLPGPDGLRRLQPGPVYWAAFLAGHRVDGSHDTAEEAMAAADEAHEVTASKSRPSSS